MAYRIKDWNKYFETHESRKLKFLTWVAIPTKMDGEGYTDLLDHPNGAAHFGAWCAIVEIASKQTPRGNLPSGINGTISRSLGRISRIPSKIFDEVLPRLRNIGWIEEYQSNEQHTDVPAESPALTAESPGVPGGSAGIPGIHNITEHYIRQNNTHTSSKLPTEERPVGKSQAVAEKTGVCVSEKKLPGNTSQRFHEWLALWPSCSDPDGTCRVWISRVKVSDEEKVFSCTARYMASGVWKRGFRQDQRKWLTVQADSNWEGTWLADDAELDPQIAILDGIDKQIKEMRSANLRNEREQGKSNGDNRTSPQLARIQPGVGARIIPSINGKFS